MPEKPNSRVNSPLDVYTVRSPCAVIRPAATQPPADGEENPSVLVSDYHPSGTILRLFLHTGKSGTNMLAPGLIGTYGSAEFCFYIALVAEAWGLLALWSASQFNPMFAVFLFLIDLVGALLAHCLAPKICIVRNLLLFNAPVSPGTWQALVIAGQITKTRWILTWLGRILIIGLAVWKCIAMHSVRSNFGGGSLPLFLTVIAAYVMAARAHLTYTRYAFFEMLQRFLWNREKAKFVRALQIGDESVAGWPRRNVWEFDSHVPLTECKFGRWDQHRLVSVGETRYDLITRSILTDEDIFALGKLAGAHTGISSETIKVLRRECVCMQFVVFLSLNNPGNLEDWAKRF